MDTERRIHVSVLFATPFILLGTAAVILPRDPLMAGLTFWCSGCTFGIAFTSWSRSRR